MKHLNMLRSRIQSGTMWRLVSFALFAAVSVAGVAEAGQPALLAISSPSNAAIVRPGDTLTVTVTSPASADFAAVSVVGESPVGGTSDATTLPANFYLSIPANTSSGPLLVSAVGKTVLDEVATVTVVVDVEREDMATSIAALVDEIAFEAPGEEFPIVALAEFPSEDAVEVTASSKVTYSSSDTAVAVVSTGGMVTAIAEGSATVTMTYTDSSNTVTAEIPVTVPAAVFTLDPSSFDFGNRSVNTSGNQEVTLTNSSGYTLSIAEIQTSGEFSQTSDCVSLSPLAPDATCTITLTFGPTVVGPAEGVMTIINDNRTAGFPLAGTGVTP